MKKLFGLLLLVLLGFTACEGPMGPEGPPGKDAISTEWYVHDYEIYSNDWKLNHDKDGRPFYEYEFGIPELTKFVFDEGAVVCYFVQKTGNILTQSPLPYTYYELDGDFPYSENYSCEVKPGYVKFIAKYSDFATEQPKDCIFHIVLMW